MIRLYGLSKKKSTTPYIGIVPEKIKTKIIKNEACIIYE